MRLGQQKIIRESLETDCELLLVVHWKNWRFLGHNVAVANRITPKIARELFLANSLKPIEPFVNTMTPWKSQCLKCKKIVSPNYNKVRLRGHQCKYCAGVVVDPDDAIKLMKKAGFKTLVKYPGANSPWKSQCGKCKKITSPSYTNVSKGIGCKYCGKRAVEPKDAIASMKMRGFKVLENYPGATKPWLVECLNCNKTFRTMFHSLNTLSKCKYCSGIVVDEADLLVRLKELKLKPLEKYKTAKIPWKCRCLVCNHVVQPTWNRIKQGRGHCAYCAQRRVDIPEAFNFMKSVNLKPLVDFPGSDKPWKCECLTCGLVVGPRWSDLRQGQGGCSNCADYGLNYQKPGYIYLITHDKLNSHKIGIANNYKSRKVDDRMYKHQKQGWTLFKKKSFDTVQEAAYIEAGILKWLRLDVGLQIHLKSRQMPQGGWTETVNASDIDLPIIWAKVDEMSKVKK